MNTPPIPGVTEATVRDIQIQIINYDKYDISNKTFYFNFKLLIMTSIIFQIKKIQIINYVKYNISNSINSNINYDKYNISNSIYSNITYDKYNISNSKNSNYQLC